MTRAEKVAEAQRLRAEGLLQREIAERMGVATQTVNAWLCDPDLSKQWTRRERYRGTCVDCGAPTEGSGGYRTRRTRCASCATRHQHESRFWSREQVIETLQAWAGRLGRPPTAREAKGAGADVFHAVVSREFGSWNAGLRAAGLTTCRQGEYRRVSHRKYARRSTGIAA